MSIFPGFVSDNENKGIDDAFDYQGPVGHGAGKHLMFTHDRTNAFLGNAVDAYVFSAQEDWNTRELGSTQLTASIENPNSLDSVNYGGQTTTHRMEGRAMSTVGAELGLDPLAMEALYRATEKEGTSIDFFQTHGTLPVWSLPGMATGKAGERFTLGSGVAVMDIVTDEIYERLNYEKTPSRGAGIARSGRYYAPDKMPLEGTLELANVLAKQFGAIPEGRIETILEDPKKNEEERHEALRELVKTASMEVGNRYDKVNLDVFAQAAQEGRAQGLQTESAIQLYTYEKAYEEWTSLLTAVVNGKAVGDSPESKALSARYMEVMQAMILMNGADVVNESLFSVTEVGKDGSMEWQNSAWDNLPGGHRVALEYAGYSKEDYLMNDGDLQVGNRMAYAVQASRDAARITAESTRELMFTQGTHRGWSNMTRRVSDVLMTDLAGDPYAMYFLAPTVAVGATAGLLTSAAKASASGVGKVMAYSALDGLTAGLAEGYAVSKAGQYDNMIKGRQLEYDYGQQYQNMALYGGLGAVAGGALSGLLVGGGPAIKSLSKYSDNVASWADTRIAKSGVFSDAARADAINREVARQAAEFEVEGAQLFPNIENKGLAIRLNRGDVEAKDVISEVLPLIVSRGTDDLSPTEASSLLNKYFSSEVLAENGLSQPVIVDALFAVQRKLGSTQKISVDQFEELMLHINKGAKEHARKFGTKAKDTADLRVKAVDEAVASAGRKNRANFAGGVGKSLTKKEQVQLNLLMKKLKGGNINERQLGTLVKLSSRLNNSRSIGNIRKALATRMTPEAMEEVDTLFNKAIAQGAEAANESSFLNRALKVEDALSLLRNERTVGVADELGVSPGRIMQYIDKLKGVVGDEKALRSLNVAYPDVEDAINKIAAGDGLKVLDEMPPVFDAEEFLSSSKVFEDLEELFALRKRIMKGIKRATKRKSGKSASPERVEAAADRILGKVNKRYRELSKKLGINLDQAEAQARLLESTKKEIEFSRKTGTEQEAILDESIGRLILRTAPDAVDAAEDTTTKNFMASRFTGTSVWDKFERNWAKVVTYALPQQKLFRSSNRIVRGLSYYFGSQHVSNRVYGNSTNFLSVESIIEDSARQALPFVNLVKQLRKKLGSDSYQEFDTFFAQERQMGRLTGKPAEYSLENAPAGLLKRYESLGGEEALRMDLFLSQKRASSFFSRAIDEAKEAGIPLGDQNGARYMPHSLRGGLSPERLSQFADSFEEVRQSQLGKSTSYLDRDIAADLGWIKIEERIGRTAEVQKNHLEFSVPDDSPFAISSVMSKRVEYANKFLSANGKGQLTLLSEEMSAATTGAADSLGSGIRTVDEEAVDLRVVRERVNAIPGNTADQPVGLSQEAAGRYAGTSRGISGTDQQLIALEDSWNQAARTTPSQRAAYEEATGETFASLQDDILNQIRVRRMALVNAVIDNAGTRSSKPGKRIRRKKMNANQKIKAIENRAIYGDLSEGHSALLVRLDDLIAQGLLNDDSARLVMLAFVDVDPRIMAGMSFGRVDVARLRSLGTAYGADGNEAGLVTLRSLAEREGADAVEVAATLIHETSHIAFLSAPARLQASLQGLLAQAKAGGNDIVRLFEESGVNVEHALSNVHEFTAALAEITLLRNNVQATKSGPLKEFMAYLGKFFKKLTGDVALLTDENQTLGIQILGKERYSSLERTIKEVWNTVPTDDSSVASRMQEAFDVTPDSRIDKYGISADQLSKDELEASIAKLSRKVKTIQGKIDNPKVAPKDRAAYVAQQEEALDKARKELDDLRGQTASEKPAPTGVAAITPKVFAAVEKLDATRGQMDAVLNVLTRIEVEGDKVFRIFPARDGRKELKGSIDEIIERDIIKHAFVEESNARKTGREAFDNRAVRAAGMDMESDATLSREANVDSNLGDPETLEEMEAKKALLRESTDEADREAVEVAEKSQRTLEAFRKAGVKEKKNGKFETSTISEEQAEAIASDLTEDGMTASKVKKVYQASGPLAPAKVDEAAEILSENLDSLQNRIEMDTLDQPEIQEVVQVQSVGKTPVIKTEPEAPAPAPAKKYDNAPDTGFLGIPGYTRMSQDDLNKIIDESDNSLIFLSRMEEWDMPNEGDGVTYMREAAGYYQARKDGAAARLDADADIQALIAEREGAAARLDAEADIEALRAEREDLGLPSLSDTELKARWDNDAKKRVNRDQQGLGGGQDEATFAGMEGPEGSFLPRLSDAEVKARWDNDAKARVNRDQQGLGGGQDEATFAGMEGPEGIVGPAPRAGVEPEAPAAPRVDDVGGEEPPAPPKAPADAAGDAPDPDRLGVSPGLRKYLDNRNEASVDMPFNANHRLAFTGKTLDEIYMDTLGGSTEYFSPQAIKAFEDAGRKVQPTLRRVAEDYINHAGGKYKSTMDGSVKTDDMVRGLDSASNMARRTFNESDFDGEGGEKLAKLFSDSGSSGEGILKYAHSTLGSIRVQKSINELTGSTGMSMEELFTHVRGALIRNLERDDVRGGRTLTKKETQEIDEYMEGLKKLYLRSRGMTPRETTTFSQQSRIIQNLAYSTLGAGFAMNVLFVEAPLGILRASGLNPLKLIENTTTVFGSFAKSLGSEAQKYGPTQRFMSSLGIDQRIQAETLDDLTFSIDNLQSTSLSRFGAGGEGLEGSQLMFGLRERAQAHWDNLKGSMDDSIVDPSFTAKLLNATEAGTGALADMTGALSFMHPVTLAVREVASNQAKATLLKQVPGLTELAKWMAAAGDKGVTQKSLIGKARELKVPQSVAIYASNSGLLKNDGALLEALMAVTDLTPESAGRDLNLNQLSDLMDARRMTQTDSSNAMSIATDGLAQAKAEEDLLPALNQYILSVLGEFSPELRGSMKYQGGNPLMDLLFQMTSYPMAAYQALVANGVTARGPLATAGLMTVLTGLEYANRNLKTALNGDRKEEDRQAAIDRLTRVPTMDDVMEVIATQGTASPFFGQMGNYVRDLIGNPLLRATGHEARNFPASPFGGPAIGMAKRMYGNASKAAGSVGTGVREGDTEKMEESWSGVADTLYDISPANAMAFQPISGIFGMMNASQEGATETNTPMYGPDQARLSVRSNFADRQFDFYDKVNSNNSLPDQQKVKTKAQPAPAPAAAPQAAAPKAEKKAPIQDSPEMSQEEFADVALAEKLEYMKLLREKRNKK